MERLHTSSSQHAPAAGANDMTDLAAHCSALQRCGTCDRSSRPSPSRASNGIHALARSYRPTGGHAQIRLLMAHVFLTTRKGTCTAHPLLPNFAGVRGGTQRQGGRRRGRGERGGHAHGGLSRRCRREQGSAATLLVSKIKK